MTRPLHQSGLKVAAVCLKRFHAERIEGADGSSTASDFGTIGHKCIEEAYVASATGSVSQLQAALATLDGIAKDRLDVPASTFARLRDVLRAVYSDDSSLWLRLPGPGDKMQVEWTWGLTTDFVACKPDDPECAYTGRCDEVRWGKSGVRERDWKFVQAMHSKEDAFESIQRRVYAVALLAHFPIDVVTGSFVMCLHDYEAEAEFKRDEPWHRQTKAWMRLVRDHVLRAEERNKWPATVGEACGFCPIRHRCDEWNAAYAQGKTDDLSIEERARRYLRDKAAASENERALRKYCEDASVTVGVGRCLGFKPGTRKVWKYGVADLLAQLRADGATDEDLQAWFPGPSISKSAMEAAATVLLKRGEIECAPWEYVDLLREEVPSATFTVFAEDAPVPPPTTNQPCEGSSSALSSEGSVETNETQTTNRGAA